MSLLSTTPSPSSLFSSKHTNLHNHNHNHPLSSFSLLSSSSSSSTPLLSLSSTRPSSRTFSSRSSSDKDDEWGQEPKSRSKRKPKSSSGGPRLPNFTISGSDDDDDDDEWGDEPKPDPKPKPKPKSSSSSVGPRVPNFTISGSNEEEEEGDDEWGQEPDPDPKPKPSSVEPPAPNSSASIPDEWGENSEPEPEADSKFSDPDLPIREDEDDWAPPIIDDEKPKVNKNLELKRCLLDSVYGSDLGFRASAEVRAEVLELVTQLEAVNPAPNPTEVPGLLDGNWILVYTAFSELFPLLAVGNTPLLKVQQIAQAIDTTNQSVENSTILSSPFATFSFSATATFEVRSPSRIQVRFKEATFKPPEIKSQIDLPENVNLFGQNITLPPVQQFLNPLQEAATSISRALYGLPPLKISIPGERTASWLLFTYVDEDFRISRGDGGLFVLVREGSPLLD